MALEGFDMSMSSIKCRDFVQHALYCRAVSNWRVEVFNKFIIFTPALWSSVQLDKEDYY